MKKTLKIFITCFLAVLIGVAGYVAGYISSNKSLLGNEIELQTNMLFTESIVANAMFKSKDYSGSKDVYKYLLESLTDKERSYHNKLKGNPTYQYHLAFTYSRLAELEKLLGNVKDHDRYRGLSQATLQKAGINMDGKEKAYFDEMASCLGKYYEY